MVDEATEKRKNELKGKFKGIDADGSGYLDEKEFMTLLNNGMKQKQTISSQQMKKLFNSCDKNMDGRINFDEFVDFIYSNESRADRKKRESVVDASTDDEALWPEVEAVFKKFVGGDNRFEGRDFRKMMIDCDLKDTNPDNLYRLENADIDMIFSKYKGKKSWITFDIFKTCLRAVAKKKNLETWHVQKKVIELGVAGPSSQHTQAEPVRFHDDPDAGVRAERTRPTGPYDPAAEKEMPWDTPALKQAFDAFADSHGADGGLGMAEFMKLCKECGLITKDFIEADVDICFAKYVGTGAGHKKSMPYDKFQEACRDIAHKSKRVVEDVQTSIMKSGGPKMSGVTEAKPNRFYDDPKAGVRAERSHKSGPYEIGDDEMPWDTPGLKDAFLAFADSSGSNDGGLGHAEWAKLCKDCGLIVTEYEPKYTAADVDITFAKYVGTGAGHKKNMDWITFQEACRDVAHKSNRLVESIQQKVKKQGGPSQTGVTAAPYNRFHDDVGVPGGLNI